MDMAAQLGGGVEHVAQHRALRPYAPGPRRATPPCEWYSPAANGQGPGGAPRPTPAASTHRRAPATLVNAGWKRYPDKREAHGNGPRRIQTARRSRAPSRARDRVERMDLTLPEGLNPATLIIAAAIAVPVVFLIFQVRRRMARHRRTLEEIVKKGGERIPLSLHPVIDPDICIGSLTCLKSCPEGDILGVVNGAARL